jgi:hypothetical protein
MAGRRYGTQGRGRLAPYTLLATFVVVLVAVPAATLAASATPTSSATVVPAASSGPTATVTWNGANILNYTSATSAARISFNGVVDVHYEWPAQGTVNLVPYTINDARLQIFYFGYALSTRDVVNSAAVPSTSGFFDMNWSTGSLQYILEGSYRLVASLIAQNGTTMWSQAFWVYVAAPFYVGALLPIVLILIAVWEIYNVATVGKQAALGTKKQPPTSGSSPSSSGPESGSSTEPTGATAPADGGTTPPSDGGSS